jgi:uncharacterized membrane protein YbhN (UPF0104 family)
VSEPDPFQGQSPYTSARTLLRRTIWGFVAALVITFLVLAVVAQVAKLPHIDWHFSPGWLVLSAVAILVFQGMHAETWRRILHDLHGDIPPRKAWVIWNVSLLARYVPTQVLMAVTRVTMAQREGVPKRITIASIVYELALVTAASIVVAAWGFTQLPELSGSAWRYVIFCVPVIAIACLHPRVFSHVSGRLAHRFGSDELPSTLSFATVLRMEAVYVASFLIAGLATLGMVRALHSIDPADVPLIISSWSVGYAGALLAFFVPGGIGVREGAVAIVLSAAVPTGVAIAAAIAIRLGQTACELLYAGASVLYARRMPELSDARKAEVSAKESGVPIS